jgi:uncharacterized protein
MTEKPFAAGLVPGIFMSHGFRLLGRLYTAAGPTPRPTAILLHGLPGIELHLDVAYRLRDLGWNCLLFHFRGSWGSHGNYSLDHLADDTRAAIEWACTQPNVDASRLAVIGASTGFSPACATIDRRVAALVGISPVIDPARFVFPANLAREFAAMLQGVSGEDLVKQWGQVPSVIPALRRTKQPVLLIAAENDDIFPASEYADVALPNIRLITHPAADHNFSTVRPWRVTTVTDWLVATCGV